MHFVDTNVLVYALDLGEPEKQRRAQEYLTDPHLRLVVSPQVLGEFYVTLQRRFGERLTADEARALVDGLTGRCSVSIDAEVVRRAIVTSQRHQLSYWDALIVESAVEAGCDRIATEDLQHGAVIRGVEIWNPFLDAA